MLAQLLALSDALRHRGRLRVWPDDHAIGRRGEDIAHRFLQRKGIIVVGRNYRMESGAGELDLIGWDHETLVFVEVKTRQSDEFGDPDRAIGPEKLRNLTRAARDYARHAETPWESVRFDVITVILRKPPVLAHFKDVVPIRSEVRAS